MIPSWWHMVLLTLAAYRLTRLLGWDSFPLARRLRMWLMGATWMGEEWRYGRPVVVELMTCPFCLGWWVCVAVWAGWLLWPQVVLVAAVPLGLSALVGLLAKNLDA